MKLALVIITLALTASAEQPVDIAKLVRSTPAPELGALAVRLVRLAPASDKARVGGLVIEAVKAYRPSALQSVAAAMKVDNRPPVTPGNEHGNRPETPPGRDKYGSP